jgi:hypothetical protein
MEQHRGGVLLRLALQPTGCPTTLTGQLGPSPRCIEAYLRWPGPDLAVS